MRDCLESGLDLCSVTRSVEQHQSERRRVHDVKNHRLWRELPARDRSGPLLIPYFSLPHEILTLPPSMHEPVSEASAVPEALQAADGLSPYLSSDMWL